MKDMLAAVTHIEDAIGRLSRARITERRQDVDNEIDLARSDLAFARAKLRVLMERVDMAQAVSQSAT